MNRLFQYAALTAAVLSLAACSDDGNFAHYDVDAPRITSFGFYAEDNPEYLSSDYVVDLSNNQSKGTSTVNVSVPMPATVVKSSLIARFTLSDNTTATVNGTEQVSQSTVNDFTVPVDYILTKNGVNVRYAITVTKATNLKWTEVAQYTEYTTYGDPIMKINPKDNLPYVAFKVRSDDNYHPTVIKFTGDEWQHVGDNTFGHMVRSSYIDFSIAPDGTPYVAYSDNELSNTTTTLSGAMSVMGFDGTTWNFIGGDQGVLKAQSNYIGLAALDGELVAAQQNNSARADYSRRVMVVSNYRDGAWTSQTPSMLTNQIFALNMANSNDAAYVISVNRGSVGGVNYGYNLLKYQNGEWSAMITNFVETGNSFNNIYMYECTVDANGTPYIWTIDNVSGTAGVRVKYYDAVSDSWLTLSGNTLPLGFVPTRQTEVALAVANDGTPYVVYTNENDQSYPYMMYLDSETNQWSSPTKVADYAASGLNLAFTHTGVGYLTFSDDSNNLHTYVYK